MRKFDWQKIEAEYRAGGLSIAEIARMHGCTPGAIHNRAKRYGWTRDHTAQYQQTVRAKVTTDYLEETINEAADRAVSVIRSHRRDIQKAQKMVNLLSAQLYDAAADRDRLIEEIGAETASDRSTRRGVSLQRAVSLPAHAGVLRDLTVALKNLIGLERQAFNLDDKDPGGGDDNGFAKWREESDGETFGPPAERGKRG